MIKILILFLLISCTKTVEITKEYKYTYLKFNELSDIITFSLMLENSLKLPEYTLISLIYTESKFYINAKRFEKHLNSSSLGVTQIIEKYKEGYLSNFNVAIDKVHLLNPYHSIIIAGQFIRIGLDKGCSMKKVLSIWNAGEKGFLKNKGMKYATNILNKAEELKEILNLKGY